MLLQTFLLLAAVAVADDPVAAAADASRSASAGLVCPGGTKTEGKRPRVRAASAPSGPATELAGGGRRAAILRHPAR